MGYNFYPIRWKYAISERANVFEKEVKISMPHRVLCSTLNGLIFLMLVLSGCKSGPERLGTMRSLFVSNVTVHVSLPPNGNEGTAVAVDFLTVHNPELAEKLMETDAKTWFMAKNQFKNDFTAGKDFDLEEREYAPGSIVRPIKLPWRTRKTALLIYADYMTPDTHRFRATQRQEWILTLNEKEFIVVPKK